LLWNRENILPLDKLIQVFWGNLDIDSYCKILSRLFRLVVNSCWKNTYLQQVRVTSNGCLSNLGRLDGLRPRYLVGYISCQCSCCRPGFNFPFSHAATSKEWRHQGGHTRGKAVSIIPKGAFESLESFFRKMSWNARYSTRSDTLCVCRIGSFVQAWETKLLRSQFLTSRFTPKCIRCFNPSMKFHLGIKFHTQVNNFILGYKMSYLCTKVHTWVQHFILGHKI
jgi:hypothetical protein